MVGTALRIVFQNPWYVFVASLIGVAVASTTLLWHNFPLLMRVWTDDATSGWYTVTLGWNLLRGAVTSVGWVTVLLVCVLSVLLGMVFSMTVYAWREKRIRGSWGQLSAATGGGVFAALLGIGCAVCGPLLLASIVTLVGATGFLLILPLHGLEFGFVAIFLLLYALYTVSKVVVSTNTCAS